MAQLMIIAGSALVLGSGLFQLIKGEPYKSKEGVEMSMKASRNVSLICVLVGALGMFYGFTMS